MADLTRLAPPLPGGFTQDDVDFLKAQGFTMTNGGDYSRAVEAHENKDPGQIHRQFLCFNHWADNPLEGARRRRGWYAATRSLWGESWESPIFDTLMAAYVYAEVEGWQS